VSVERIGGHEGAGGSVRGEFGRVAVSVLLQPAISAHGPLAASVSSSNAHEEFRAHASTASGHGSSSLDDGNPIGGEDNELANLLAGIAAEVERMVSGMCQAIMADFAGKIACARQSLPRDQVAGAISALKAAQQAALAMARQSAAAELVGRREAAISTHRRPSQAVGDRLGRPGLN
jgi:hypothetical protein